MRTSQENDINRRETKIATYPEVVPVADALAELWALTTTPRPEKARKKAMENLMMMVMMVMMMMQGEDMLMSIDLILILTSMLIRDAGMSFEWGNAPAIKTPGPFAQNPKRSARTSQFERSVEAQLQLRVG